MNFRLLLSALLLIWSSQAWSQCQTNIDFNTWIQEGFASNGNWIVQNGGAAVFQTINGNPTFYVSPDTFINVRINGTIRVEDNFDDDFVGFVFGYKQPTTNNNFYDLYLFDWKQNTQFKSPNHTAFEGFTLSRANGNIFSGSYLTNFWGHANTAVFNVIDTDYGNTRGWNSFTNYNFTLLYTSTRATIIVNNDTIFDVPGCYEPGRFGFYNYSQPSVRYSNFSYELISNFEIKNNDYDQCVDQPVKFIFTDSTCLGGVSATDNIASWVWEFGDGGNSGLINPLYTYDSTGTYQVKLKITDINGCEDSIFKAVTIHPPPTISTVGDTVFCPSDSVNLTTTGGVEYKWSPSAGLEGTFLSDPAAFPDTTTTYLVEVKDQYGCKADTTVTFYIFEGDVGAPQTICFGDTIGLGASGGVAYAWDPPLTVDDATSQNPQAFPTITTDYQVVIYDSLGGCTDTLNQLVNVNALPIVDVGPDTAVCSGQPVTLNVVGANTYFWTNSNGNILGGGTSKNITPGDTITYYVTGIDGNNCQNIDSTEVIVYPLPIINGGPDTALCHYETVLLGDPVNPPINFAWSPGTGLDDASLVQPTFTPVNGAGTYNYTFTGTDARGCESTENITVTVFETVAITAADETICFGDTTNLAVTGADIYDWSPTGTINDPSLEQPKAFPPVTTVYTVVALDTNTGCYDTTSQIVNVNALPIVDVGPDTAICIGESVTLNVIGANTYIWTDENGTNLGGGTSQTVSPNDTLTYYVLGTDGNNCQNIDSTRLIIYPLPIIDAGLDTTLCLYEIVTIGSPNNPPGTYTWSPGGDLSNNSVLEPDFDPVAPGNYTFTLTGTDLNGCTNEDSAHVVVHDFSMSVIGADVPCFGEPTGTSAITVVGTGPFVYSWLDSGGGVADQELSSISPGISDSLFADSYLATVIDANGCTDTIPIVISEPAAPLSVMIDSLGHVDCFGNANGELHVSSAGGTPGYEFSIDGFVFNTTGVFSGLGASIYTIISRDANGCETTVSDTVTTPTGLFAQINTIKHIDCFGNDNGALALNGVGGTPPYSYSFDNINFFNTVNVTGLSPGVDTVFFVDDNSCLVALPFEIFEPTPLVSSIDIQKDVDCFGNATGQVWLTNGGGRAPYEFTIDGGTNYQPDSTFDALIAGMYTITVRDDSLCTTDIPFTIIEPPLLTGSIIYQENVDCFGNATGDVVVQATGGSPGYMFSQDSLLFFADSAFLDLTAGNYTITIVDDSSCVTEVPVIITEPTELDLINDIQANVACFGDSTAFVQLLGQGGTLPYSFSIDNSNFGSGSLFDQLPSGNYMFWVVDDSACVDSISVSITEPDRLTLDLDRQKDIDCFGNDNGYVMVFGGGGVRPYQFSLDGGSPQSDSLFEMLTPGQHTITITDDSLCTEEIQIDIYEPPLLDLSTTDIDITCFGYDDGQGELTINGGTAPFDIQWDTPNGDQTAIVSDLPPGLFYVIVTDDSGCVEIDSIDIFEPELLVINLVDGSLIEAFCAWPNGQASVEATGGTIPHSFRWEGPNLLEGSSVNELFGDSTYTAYVLDANGCETSIEVFVPHTPPAVPFFMTDPTHEDSILLSRAEIDFTNLSQGGVAYQWDFGDGMGLSDLEHPTYQYLEPGVYQVTLTAFNSYFVCPTDTTLTLHIIPDGSIFIPTAFSPNGDGINDEFYAKGEGLVRYQLAIFDRWGQQIAVYNDLNQGWDGMRNGRPVPEGVYVYRITAQMNNGKQIDRGGSITVIR